MLVGTFFQVDPCTSFLTPSPRKPTKQTGSFHILSTFLPWPFGGLTLKNRPGIALDMHIFFNSKGQTFLRYVRQLHQEASKIVDEAKKDPSTHERRDLIALYLNARDKDGQPAYTDEVF
jgi:cytochrome P450